MRFRFLARRQEKIFATEHTEATEGEKDFYFKTAKKVFSVLSVNSVAKNFSVFVQRGEQ
jgi:hypothetical protein